MLKLRERGIALFLLIVITSLLLILLGAFFQVNRDQLTLAGYSSQSELANRACTSATEYCFFRLEHNKYWGRAAFDSDFTDGSVAPEAEVREIGGSHRIEGRLTDLDAEFRVDITNNLSGSSESGGVPTSTCRLRITGTCRGATQKREVLLRIAPLFDGAAVSSGGINIDATSLKLTSEHPLRNQIRSKGDIHVPSANRLDFVPAVAQADKGVIWSQQDVTVGGQSVTNQSVMANAVSQTGGRFIPDAKTNYDIHDLKISEIGVDANTTVRSGLYLFSRVQVEYEVGGVTQTASVKVLERRTQAIDDAGFSSGELQEFWYVSEPGGVPEGARMAGTSVVGHPRDPAF
ncbi:MAG: hypothetical protein KC910_31205, partial [Candidatus Eremiobacteraeota bacterium]|nr:hypothetical protein [Candidatus Eremiobacteraeota bacterium]